MKNRAIGWSAVVVALIGSLVFCLFTLGGCGRKQEAEGQEEDQAPQVSVERTDESGGSVVVEGTSPSGEQVQAKVDVKKVEPTEQDLGAPIYPKAQFSQESGADATVSAGDKELRVVAADFVTGDSYRAVVDWYRKKLGEPLMSLAEETTWIKGGDEKSMVTVVVRVQDGKTWINIRKLAGDLDLPLPQIPQTTQ